MANMFIVFIVSPLALGFFLEFIREYRKKLRFTRICQMYAEEKNVSVQKKKNIEIIKWFNWPEFGAIDINVKREKLQRQWFTKIRNEK